MEKDSRSCKQHDKIIPVPVMMNNKKVPIKNALPVLM